MLNQAKHNISKVYGLVLSGGKSTRMGRDKGEIHYHNKPQREYLYELLSQVCDKTFLSLRKDQLTAIPPNMEFIVDRNEFKGPFNGILSAHHYHSDVAWLVVACDLPLLDLASIKQLLRARQSTKTATAYSTSTQNLPEPLAAIWEPEGLAKAKSHMESSESSCPRKFLINSDISLVYPEKDALLTNANSLQDYEEVLIKLQSK